MTTHSEPFQVRFHRRWSRLSNSHVRTLAWLIDAPDLLDPQAPQWQGRIASLPNDAGDVAAGWLHELDRDPSALETQLDLRPQTRLGRYAESLMAFYLRHLGVLEAQGVQVRADKGETIGEFDFIVRQPQGLVHWEFATKLYLLESAGRGLETDYFVGPNLADTLGKKMRKIFDRQLSLADHPAATAVLPAPVCAAQALVKGWLFYHESDPPDAKRIGVSANHCRGFWCTAEELESRPAERYAILSRLRWLPPLKSTIAETLDAKAITQYIAQYFANDTMPVLVALMKEEDGTWIESERGFVVPQDWQLRAERQLAPAATGT